MLTGRPLPTRLSVTTGRAVAGIGRTPSREIEIPLALGAQVGIAAAELVGTLADADNGAGLPEHLSTPTLLRRTPSRRATDLRWSLIGSE